jgi:hypothetical protein
MVAECGCPYDPVYDEGSLGWHLVENHPEMQLRLRTPFGVIRQPTAEECELVGRETSYSEPFATFDYRDLGDYVIESIHNDNPESMAKLADTCEALGMCDAAHVIPAGVYLEE